MIVYLEDVKKISISNLISHAEYEYSKLFDIELEAYRIMSASMGRYVDWRNLIIVDMKIIREEVKHGVSLRFEGIAIEGAGSSEV